MTTTRRLAAIMFTDIKDFTKRMNAQESLGMRLLEKHNTIMDGALERHSGTLVKNIGDAYLVEFGSAVNAVEAAMDAQGLFARINADASADEEVLVRISIHLGDVVIQGSDVFGDGVNIASRLQSITPPGGICLSADVYTHVKGKVDAQCISVGSHALKGVAEQIEVYQVLTALVPGPIAAPAPTASTERSDAPADDAPPRIAVLPFANWSDDKENEYFSDGIAEDIITDLARITGLNVSSRNSVFSYKGKNVPVKEIGAQLGVRYVLEGSVRRAGSRLRITAQLIDTQTDGHLWADRFDRDMADIFAIQDEIAKHIAGELRIRLTKDQVRALQNRGTKNLDAYDLYMKGQFHSRRRTRSDLAQAEEHLQAALLLDPDFAEAHTALAWVLRFKFAFGIDRAPRNLEEAKTHTQSALALNPDLPEAVLMKGLLLREEDGRIKEAIAVLEDLVRRHPSFVDGRAYLGNALHDVGMHTLAMEHHAKAMELDPRYHVYPYSIAEDMNALGRDIREAEPLILKAAALPPNHYLILWYRAVFAALKGDEQGADRLIEEMMQADSGQHSPRGLRGTYRAILGRYEEACDDFRFSAQTGSNEPIVVYTCLPALASLRKFTDALPLIDATLHNWEYRFVKGMHLQTLALSYQALIRRAQGDAEGARNSFRLARDKAEGVVKEFPEGVTMRATYAVLLAACGEGEAALAESEQMQREFPGFPRLRYFQAQIYALLHDKKGLLDALRIVLEQGTFLYWEPKYDLWFSEYENDPDFLKVAERSRT